MIDEDVYIVDVVRQVVQKVSENLTVQLQSFRPIITGVHFLTGHHTEIKERLINLSKSPTGKFDRYPLVALFQDIKETYGDSGGYAFYAPIQVMILYLTKPESYIEERIETVFKPILRPIQKEFEKQLYKHNNVVFEYEGKRRIEKTERPHWGAPAKYGNDGYILTDVLDGIELFIPRLTFQKQNC